MGKSSLVRLEEESIFSVIDHRYVFILSRLLGREFDVSKYPSLHESLGVDFPLYYMGLEN